MRETGTVEAVRAFWDTEACGTQFVADSRDERDFYRRYSEFRDRTEWHIPRLVPFAETQGRDVLELGCGNGADGVRFAAHGARYTGVDLTQAAVDATARHFAVAGQPGTFQVENAERLSFADASFDFVYSYGVLHHTPDPERAFAEVYRVLRPGGTMLLMLYHRHSFNFYARIMGYMRLRVLWKALTRAAYWRADREAAQDASLTGLRGNDAPAVWDVHYRNLLRHGWGYLKADNFVHHATDGPECPYARAYTRADARRLFARFRQLELNVAHFPLRKYPFSQQLPFKLEEFLATKMGWYLMIRALK